MDRFDAFTGLKIFYHALECELVSVDFNAAALSSQEAVAARREGPEGHDFLEAANLFKSASQDLAKLKNSERGESVYDLHPSTISALSSIMKAQSSEMIFELESSRGNESTKLAQFASCASNEYQESVRLTRVLVQTGFFQKIWLALLEVRWGTSKPIVLG